MKHGGAVNACVFFRRRNLVSIRFSIYSCVRLSSIVHSCGIRQRTRDHAKDARGTLAQHSLRLIKEKMPRLVIMENVVGLVERHQEAVARKTIPPPLTTESNLTNQGFLAAPCPKLETETRFPRALRDIARSSRPSASPCGRPGTTSTLGF